MRGIFAAAMSIIKDDLTLDIESTIKHSENVIIQGAHGCVVFGSTGMSQLLGVNEKKNLLEKLSDSKFKKKHIIGTGLNSLVENIDFLRHSLKYGFNKFLLMPPAYYKYGDEDAYSFYVNLIDKVPDAKIILYNFEKLCGYKFSISIVEKLAKNFPEQIIGVKDSSYNLFENLKIPNFFVFPGSEKKLLKGLELGCSGIISATCNITSNIARKVFDDFESKNKQTLDDKLCSIRQVFDNYNLISALHSFLSVKNKKYDKILPPLRLLSDNQLKELLFKLKELDFIPKNNIAA